MICHTVSLTMNQTDIIAIYFVASVLILVEVEDMNWKKLDLFNEVIFVI